MSSDCAGPPRQRVRREDDIPLDFSALPAVQELIIKNNRQTKLKRRLKTSDFVNESFSELGCRAVADRTSVGVLSSFLKECTEKHRILPRSSSVARVLYSFVENGLLHEGQALLQQILQAEASLRSKVMDEKVATISLRLLTESDEVNLGLAERIISMLPEGSHKRRLFSPLLEHAARTGDTTLAFKALRMGRQKQLEFWDVDYKQLLRCLQSAAKGTDISALITELLECMVDHHPVVGKTNGEALQQLLGGELTEVNDETGMCCRCSTRVHTFDFAPDDRVTLLRDIETKLIAPRVESGSHYEPGKVVELTERKERWEEFAVFKDTLSRLDYDAVIDGANVGYYGLSNWYRGAKEALLRSRGVDPSTLPEYELCEIPLPVDVPPKFSLIDEMLTEAQKLRKKSVVMLHSRHVRSPSKENLVWLEKWGQESSLIVCPGFLNDDYCWLFAAIHRPNCLVVSNDQMRDHHFSLLSRRSFLRWRQRHLVTYRARFSWATGAVSLLLSLPRPYAVWVQRGQLSPSHWHVPVRTTLDVIDQATNRKTESEMEVDKNGDDFCNAWLCTAAINR
ncbi:hypothetical protein, conserved [Trypanosoma brucei brucei TREU927]|uniref:PRORP domain-containing protein n=1 Tax=Trypanosoma brucei brucei (strain 927/4 GUTat10.1) TaxID=185431 RepID=Q38E68_TRYB2|nr:hypothetical protein, conserved [Trypanosoma brucei brucei TREU927]EAN76902.1 hypothetical protein, conserved [Trypanosoma brucei brucei TREU927]